MKDTKTDLIWIDHQGGKLGYYLDGEGNAVLCDYIGNTTVLYLPSVLEDGQHMIFVSGNIPNESFKSCSNVKLIVVDCRDLKWDFGCRLFKNCTELNGVVDLNECWDNDDYGLNIPSNAGYTSWEELSFVCDDYVPKSLKRYNMAFESCDFNLKIVDFLCVVSRNGIEKELVEVLRYNYPYTKKLLNMYDDSKEIRAFVRQGFDLIALRTIGMCWKKIAREDRS